MKISSRTFGGTSLALLAASAFLALPARTGGADDAPPADTAAVKEPKLEAVTKGEFKVTLDLNGSFDALRTWEVFLDAEQWGGELEFVECAAAGPVEKGATLVRFKTDKIDEALGAAERDLNLARLGLQRQTEDLKRQEELQQLGLRQVEMQAEAADQALKRFLEWEKELRLQEADQRLKQTSDNIADQEEELRQLEKMYKADELTEETEEIVLMRARRQLDRSKFWQTSQLKRDEVWRTQDFPRDEENLKNAQRKTALDLEKAKTNAEPALEAAKIEYEKAKANLAKQEENFAKLQRDREKFTLTAPESGLAVYGQLNRNGSWNLPEVPSAETIAQGRAKTKPNQVLFTILKPGDVEIRTTVPEASILSVAAGQKARVKPGAAPRTSLDAAVTTVAPVAAGGNYEVRLGLASPDARFLAGQSCKITLTTSEKSDALTVAAGAVESDGDDRWVHVWADGKATRTKVETGETSGGRTEILSGVEEGARVLAAPPKSK